MWIIVTIKLYIDVSKNTNVLLYYIKTFIFYKPEVTHVRTLLSNSNNGGVNAVA